MSREDEAAIVAAWLAYTAGRGVDKHTYLDFIDTRVKMHARWRRVSVFEILDVLTNLPERARQRQTA
ncbi:MAG: hypothetical protein HC809_17015 [Gammaproteobacteria bacterium]|nr:hypothetical protein [Gammaproteobacteria bacterium]